MPKPGKQKKLAPTASEIVERQLEDLYSSAAKYEDMPEVNRVLYQNNECFAFKIMNFVSIMMYLQVEPAAAVLTGLYPYVVQKTALMNHFLYFFCIGFAVFSLF